MNQTPTPSLICFICTANICRSAFAEVYCKNELNRLGLADRFEVFSTGIRAVDGYTPPPEIIDIAKEFDVDLSAHRSTALVRLPIENCRFILTMEQFHLSEIERLHPQVAGKVYLLRNFATTGSKQRDITDPVGLSPDFLRVCFDDIIEAVNGFIDKLSPTPGITP